MEKELTSIDLTVLEVEVSKKINFGLTQKIQKALENKNDESYRDVGNVKSFCNFMDYYKERSQIPRKPNGKIHPSSIGNCPRLMYFNMKMIPYTNWKPVSADTKRIFDIGHSIENFILRDFYNLNILIASQVKIDYEPDRFSGTCDAIIHWDGATRVIDIKTANKENFYGKIPHKKYLYQLSSYMLYSGISHGFLYYVCKNDSKTDEVHIKITDPVVRETENLIKMYNYNFDNNIVPDVTEIRSKCTENTCPYFKHCMRYPETHVFEQASI